MITAPECLLGIWKCHILSFRLLQRLKFLGASTIESVTEILSVYQTPARAMSNHVQSFTAMSLQYHSGYFHLKKQPVRLMPWLSLRGDSPSSKLYHIYPGRCLQTGLFRLSETPDGFVFFRSLYILLFPVILNNYLP